MTSETLSTVRTRLTAKKPPRRLPRMAVSGHGAATAFFSASAIALTLLAAPRFAAQAVLLPVSDNLRALQMAAPLTAPFSAPVPYPPPPSHYVPQQPEQG